MYDKKWDPGLKIGETISKFFSHFSRVFKLKKSSRRKLQSSRSTIGSLVEWGKQPRPFCREEWGASPGKFKNQGSFIFSSRNVYGIQNNTQNKHHSLCLRFENKGIDWKPSNKNSIKILNEGQMQMKNLKFKAYNTTGISTTENTALSMKERNIA